MVRFISVGDGIEVWVSLLSWIPSSITKLQIPSIKANHITSSTSPIAVDQFIHSILALRYSAVILPGF